MGRVDAGRVDVVPYKIGSFWRDLPLGAGGVFAGAPGGVSGGTALGVAVQDRRRTHGGWCPPKTVDLQRWRSEEAIQFCQEGVMFIDRKGLEGGDFETQR